MKFIYRVSRNGMHSSGNANSSTLTRNLSTSHQPCVNTVIDSVRLCDCWTPPDRNTLFSDVFALTLAHYSFILLFFCFFFWPYSFFFFFSPVAKKTLRFWNSWVAVFHHPRCFSERGDSGGGGGAWVMMRLFFFDLYNCLLFPNDHHAFADIFPESETSDDTLIICDVSALLRFGRPAEILKNTEQ